MSHSQEIARQCANCGAEVRGNPAVNKGQSYCCAGCAAGSACICSHAKPAIPLLAPPSDNGLEGANLENPTHKGPSANRYAAADVIAHTKVTRPLALTPSPPNGPSSNGKNGHHGSPLKWLLPPPKTDSRTDKVPSAPITLRLPVEERGAQQRVSESTPLPVVGVPVMTTRQKVVFYLLVGLAGLATLNYALWWFRVEHIPKNWPQLGDLSFAANAAYFGVLSIVVWRGIAANFFLWWVVRTMKRPLPMTPPPGWRVALMTCFVPEKEPYDMLERTLAAMTRVRYPHDTWVLDEGDDPVVKDMCRRLGVKHFSRKGIPRYNQTEGPFRAKTKAGNHNAWRDQYDHLYDFVAQMDMDFIPKPYYLEKTLGYFRDPDVGFVGSPQIYGNQDANIVARGAAEQAFIFYGPMMMGLYGRGTQLFIGANHAYRVKALNDIGGYVGHIVEDNLTGMRFYSHGWKSVYVPEVLAVGEGPSNWPAYFGQQMRWAFGLIDILFRHTAEVMPNLTNNQRIAYCWLGMFYLFGTVQFLGVLLTVLFLVFGWQSAHMDFVEWVVHSFPPFALAMAIFRWLQRFYINPETESGWNARGGFLLFGAWPIYLWALLSAVIGRRLPYAVTPKGKAGQPASSTTGISQFTLHLALLSFSGVALLVFPFTGNLAPHLVFWAALNTVGLGGVIFSHSRLWPTDLRLGRGFALRPAFSRAFTLLCAFSVTAVLGSVFLFFITHAPVQTTAAFSNISRTISKPFETGSGKVGASLLLSDKPAKEASSPPTLASSELPDKARFLAANYTGVALGAFDPDRSLGDFGRIAHTFIQWDDGSIDNMRKTIASASAEGKVALISWEPRTVTGSRGELVATDLGILGRISHGAYDEYIRNMARSIRDLDEYVILRFAHEMDLPNDGLHPWAGQSPDLFIAAHRRVVDIFREEGADKVRWLWSPGGYFDATGKFTSGKWYPGDAYVDFTGTTALLFWRWEEWNAYRAENHIIPTPDEFIGPEYRALSTYGKPIILPEVAIDLHPTRKAEEIPWMTEFLKGLKTKYPNIKGLVFFNVEHNLPNFDADWRLDLDKLRTILQSLPPDAYFDM